MHGRTVRRPERLDAGGEDGHTRRAMIDSDPELNDAQREAVAHNRGPLLIFAGAGSGKTRVITRRAARLVDAEGVPPWALMCVTFTNKAAGEMRYRIGSILGPERSREAWITTFHAMGAKILRRWGERVGLAKDFTIYDDSDQRALMQRVYDERKLDDEMLAPRAALGIIDRWKQEGIGPDAATERARNDAERIAAEAYQTYQRRLLASNAADFGDLLRLVLDLLDREDDVRRELQARLSHIMVDEFQDTNQAQYRILRQLINTERNICVVGDDDQAIYRWRGADVRNILGFRDDFPDAHVVKLERNYRSTGRILRAANAVIERSRTREPKRLFTQSVDGDPIELYVASSERDEAERIAERMVEAREMGRPLRDMAVFYRIHAQSRPLEEALRAENIPYVVYGGQRFYERAEIKDLLAYLRIAMFPHDDVSLLRVINQPTRGLGKGTVDKLIATASAQGISVWTALGDDRLPGDIQGAARKRLATFRALTEALHAKAGALADAPSQLAGEALVDSGYLEMLQRDPSHEAAARLENLREMIGSMQSYEQDADSPSLTDFLERVSLAEEAAKDQAGAKDRVALMTVHAAKGLEFDTVFVTGLEERMFPYRGFDPGDAPDEIEEERRLAYVAITRARKRLVLSYATSRMIFGQTRAGIPSRFLREIPSEIVRTSHPARSSWQPSAREVTHEVRNEFEHDATSDDRGSIRIEYDDASPRPAHEDLGRQFRRGMHVRHKTYGIGRVEHIEPGPELRLTVVFPGKGALRLLADYVERMA